MRKRQSSFYATLCKEKNWNTLCQQGRFVERAIEEGGRQREKILDCLLYGLERYSMDMWKTRWGKA